MIEAVQREVLQIQGADLGIEKNGGAFWGRFGPRNGCSCSAIREWPEGDNTRGIFYKMLIIAYSAACCTKRNNSYLPRQTFSCTVRSESRCELRLRYVDLVQACMDARGHHFQHIL
jgi:hypothetical protein